MDKKQHYFVCEHATPMKSPEFEGYATCNCEDGCKYDFDKGDTETICPKTSGRINISEAEYRKREFKGNKLENVFISGWSILPGIRP